MKTPHFWRTGPHDPRTMLLAPFSVIYGAIASQRLKRCGASLEIPSILIGNFTAGGAGKTPTVLALAALLKKNGETPALIARGYGGSAGRHAPLRVTHQDYHSFSQNFRFFGDEALLLARAAPTFIGVDRLGAARRAIAEIHPSVLLFDDGLQSRRIEPTLAFAVADGESGLGNGYCLPAGPIRAPIARQWPLVSALIVIGAGEAGQRLAREALNQGKRVFFAQITPRQLDNEIYETGAPPPTNNFSFKNKRLIAFAGIGYPEKFFSSLKKAGAELVSMRAFPDHHPYTARDIQRLRRESKRYGADLVTTEKDFARLPIMAKTGAFAVQAIAATLTFNDEEDVRKFVTPILVGASNAY